MENFQRSGTIWGNVSQLKAGVGEALTAIKELKVGLEMDKRAGGSQKEKLVTFRGNLTDQKAIIEYNKKKPILCSRRQKQEANYKKTLAEKLALRSVWKRTGNLDRN